MSKVYFISDIHLGLESKEKEQAKEERLLAFFDQSMKDARQLFIVGDLFDAWIEYRTVIPKGYHRILSKLHDITRSGITVHYLAGNHDFWMRDYFRDELGMKTYADAFTITIDGKNTYIHHGDGLSDKDTGYKILKKVLRNKFSVWLFSWLHPDIGIALARSSSKKSRKYTGQKNFGEEDSMLKFATKKIDEGMDIVIMGHQHQPVSHRIGGGIYINLGDWITNNSYAEMIDGTIVLKTWEK